MKENKQIQGIAHLRESFKTRQVKYGGYAALITIAVLAGLILVNLIVTQFAPQLDLTKNKLYSLSDSTIKLLDMVKTPVKFIGLWRPGDEDKNVMDVINLYLAKNKNISFEVIDPDRNPGRVIKYDRDRKGLAQGSLVVEGEKGFKVIGPYDMYDLSQNQQGQTSVTGVAVERKITSALLFAGTGTTPVIYEITGHDEIPLAALNMQESVERENYTVKSLNLLLAPIPDDASVLILNAPRRDLTREEAQKILDYLGKGGRLLVLADYGIRELANLNEVLSSYGIAFDYGVAVEADKSYVTNIPYSEIPDAVEHDITRVLVNKGQNPVLLQAAMALSELKTKRQSVEIKPLLTSSASAFLRTNLSETSPDKQPSDKPGPLVLGMAVKDPSWIDPKNPQPQARIVAIGCGNLLPIAAQLKVDANRVLFVNSVNWLGDQPERLTASSRSLYLLPLRINLIQIVIFGGLFIFIIPMAFFITGFVTWLKRRHL